MTDRRTNTTWRYRPRLCIASRVKNKRITVEWGKFCWAWTPSFIIHHQYRNTVWMSISPPPQIKSQQTSPRDPLHGAAVLPPGISLFKTMIPESLAIYSQSLSQLGGPRRNISITFGTKKIEWCGYPTMKKSDYMFRRFDTIPACNRRTDGHHCCGIVRARQNISR